MTGNERSGSSLSIALAISSFFPNVGGAEITLHNLALRLQQLGHRPVVLVSFTYWKKLRKSLSQFGYPIIPLLPKQQSWALRWGGGYLKIQDLYFSFLQRKYAFDLWQSFGAFPVGVGVTHFTAARGIPHVVRTVGYDIQQLSDASYGYREDPRIDAAIRQWMPQCSQMIALSDSVVEDCLGVGAGPDQITVIPCAVDLERFQSTLVDRSMVRERYGIPNDAFLYITVGRNHPKKGFIHLIEAVKVLSDRDVAPFHVVLVGREMEPLRQRALESGIAGLVTFVDELGLDPSDEVYQVPGKRLIDLYRSADACVFPSLLETFALINIEAMAAGLPVISTDAPGCRETISHGVTGLIAAAGNPVELAERMAQLQGSPELRSKLVAQASAVVRSQYTWEVVARQFEELYMTLVAEKETQASLLGRSS